MTLKTLAFCTLFSALIFLSAPAFAADAHAGAEEAKKPPKPHMLYDAASDLRRLRNSRVAEPSPAETEEGADDDITMEDLLQDDMLVQASMSTPPPPVLSAPPEETAAEPDALEDYLFYDLLSGLNAPSPSH